MRLFQNLYQDAGETAKQLNVCICIPLIGKNIDHFPRHLLAICPAFQFCLCILFMCILTRLFCGIWDLKLFFRFLYINLSDVNFAKFSLIRWLPLPLFPLLCRNFLVSWGPICHFLGLFYMLLEWFSGSPCPSCIRKGFPLDLHYFDFPATGYPTVMPEGRKALLWLMVSEGSSPSH